MCTCTSYQIHVQVPISENHGVGIYMYIHVHVHIHVRIAVLPSLIFSRSDEFDWLVNSEKQAADQHCCHGDVGRVEEEIVRHQVKKLLKIMSLK